MFQASRSCWRSFPEQEGGLPWQAGCPGVGVWAPSQCFGFCRTDGLMSAIHQTFAAGRCNLHAEHNRGEKHRAQAQDATQHMGFGTSTSLAHWMHFSTAECPPACLSKNTVRRTQCRRVPSHFGGVPCIAPKAAGNCHFEEVLLFKVDRRAHCALLCLLSLTAHSVSPRCHVDVDCSAPWKKC
jgi:hypothetical protein